MGKRNRVYAEFKQANLFNGPAILLIEENIPVLWEGLYPTPYDSVVTTSVRR
jgi:hypothetical protein